MSLLTSAPLRLTYAGGLYDRTAPLATGEVRPEGIELNFIPVVPPEAFWRQLKHNEFDVSELSCANFFTLFSRGDRRFIAIPVYPSRTFRHSAVYINATKGITRPEDLKGRRIGCRLRSSSTNRPAGLRTEPSRDVSASATSSTTSSASSFSAIGARRTCPRAFSASIRTACAGRGRPQWDGHHPCHRTIERGSFTRRPSQGRAFA